MQAMAEEAQTRVQKAFLQLMNDLDQTCMRKIQGDMHRCAAQCCDRTDTSLEANHNCVNKCSQALQSAQGYVEREVNAFQERIERCVLGCQDTIKEKIGANTSETQMKTFTDQFQSCVVQCADTNISKIPLMLKKMQETIKRGFD